MGIWIRLEPGCLLVAPAPRPLALDSRSLRTERVPTWVLQRLVERTDRPFLSERVWCQRSTCRVGCVRLSLCRRGLSQDGAVRARSRQHVRSKPVFGIMVGWPFVSLLPDSSLCMSVYLSARGTNPPQLQTYSPTEWRVGRS